MLSIFGRCLAVAVLALSAFTAICDVTGRVVEDHTGTPQASAGVRIYKADSGALAADLDTDSNGIFEAPGLPAGDYRVEVSKPNFIPATARLRGAGSAIVIRLVRRGAVAGSVLDHQGQPVRNASVFAIPKPAAGEPLRVLRDGSSGTFALTDERGQYRLYGLPPGEYAVAATIGASSMSVGMTGGSQTSARLGSRVALFPTNAQPRFLNISGGEQHRDIDFTIEPTTLNVVQGSMELPKVDGQFWLALTPVDQPGFAVAVTIARAGGSFRFEGVPSGSYHLFASGPCRARGGFGGYLEPHPLFARSRVDVAGQDVEGVTLGVERGRSAAFRLRLPASNAACPATTQVRLTPMEDWSMHLERSVDVTAAQTRTIEDLAPTRYQISVGKPGDSCYSIGAGTLDLTGTSSSEPREIVLAPAGSLQGRLTGTAKPGEFSIVLVSPDPASGAQPMQVAVAGDDGKFAFAGLRPGRYLITAQAAGRRWVPDLASMFEIEISGGTPTQVDLPAPAPEQQNP